MAVTHIYAAPPPGVAPDWTMPQQWEMFGDAEHSIWDLLVARQSTALTGLASGAFMKGLDTLHLSDQGIPDFAELNPRLRAATGWEVVAVPGVIPNDVFFHHLSQRRFPAANFLRDASSLDYCEEPDMFHDLFGHLPMLTDPVFANFMVEYGKAGLRAEALDAAGYLGRLYLHTVEFGLVMEANELRAFGAGLLSSYSETVHALKAPGVQRVRFDLPRVMRTDYLFNEFQRTYFVIDSFEHLLKVTAETDFHPIYERLRHEPPLAPDALCPADILMTVDA